MLANTVSTAYEEYTISLYENLNCTDISTDYTSFKTSLCSGSADGFLQLLSIEIVSLPFELFLTIAGILFIIRNKVDVPQVKDSSSDTDSVKQTKSKKSKKTLFTCCGFGCFCLTY